MTEWTREIVPLTLWRCGYHILWMIKKNDLLIWKTALAFFGWTDWNSVDALTFDEVMDGGFHFYSSFTELIKYNYYTEFCSFHKPILVRYVRQVKNLN